MNKVPEGFEPIFRSSPYLELLIGLRADKKHGLRQLLFLCRFKAHRQSKCCL
jgi:hypothetical protein